MEQTKRSTGSRVALGVALGVGLLLFLAATAEAATPRVVSISDVRVSGAGTVTVEWSASTEASGGTVYYDVYRDDVPITAASVGSLTPVTSGLTALSAHVAAASGEVTQAYVWYYTVVAKDAVANASAPGANWAPDPHGSWRSAHSVQSCTRCHNAHGGGVDYRSRDGCYLCHGDTSSSAAMGAKSSAHVEREFFDYADQTPGSRHRNATMTSGRNDCGACHTAHRSPHYIGASGSYVAASSYPKMLRVHTGSTYEYFSQATDPRGGDFCFACHGADGGTAIGGIGGSAAYGATGGDHNESGYSALPHGPETVYANDHPATNPAVQCLACHHRHASATGRLIDYRASGTSDSETYARSGLCFACHSASTSETLVAAGYAPPFSWNHRDVEAEFTEGGSAHPWAISATGTSLTCVNCHNVHFVDEGDTSAWDASRVVDPDDTTSAMSGSTYGSTPADFCMRCHDGSPPEATVTASTVVPYSPGFSTVTAPYFPGWDKTAAGYSFADAGHANATAANGRALCENCHDPHASDFPRLAAWTKPPTATGLDAGTRENTSTVLSREEHLCYRCHGNGTEGDRAAGAMDVATKMALTYAHPADDHVGRHVDTETASGLSTRHAECPDCHDPHAAREIGGTATQDSKESTAGGAVCGAYGASVTYVVQNWGTPSSFSPVRLGGGATDFEAYVCFKCHSTNTTQPSTQIDVARSFNPSNHSSHNVLGQSTSMQSAFTVVPQGQSTSMSVTWALPAASLFLSTGWTTDSKMTCTGCHTNDQNSSTQAKGPHGSSAEWLIDPDYARDFTTVGLYETGVGMGYRSGSSTLEATDVICAKCHDLYHSGQGEGGWSNEPHARSSHMIDGSRQAKCIDCHGAIPHGIGRPRLLGYTTDGDFASTNTEAIAVVSHTLSNGAPQWSKNDCATSSCHRRNITNEWP
jgi:hypothetical protein